MKCLSLFQTVAIVSCLLFASMVSGAGFDYNDTLIPLFLLLLVIFPRLNYGSAKRNGDSTEVNVESDSAFYNRVVCTEGTSPNCLTCFNLSNWQTCSTNKVCDFNRRNNICIPV
ncbi:hypothetical protein CHS0354_016559 [Potamilus streckersoni]|uniref:Uncharacterized protein n=1 Tax=Potamilus streckersoni TaxID=2493646 RepID=A0AAE0TKR4_9BIVA|nr:hypothetical protein CHS0354_016559 [Potamilus streckersoni]